MSVLKGIQAGVAARLASDPYFSNVTIVTENIGDIENKIQTAIAKLGVCVIVVTPSASMAAPDAPAPYFNNIKVLVRVVENVVLNRSASGANKPASDVAEIVASLLHQWTPDGISECIFLEEPSITLGNDPRLLSYDVRCRTQGGLSYTIPSTAQPVIVLTGSSYPQTATITCATAGAAIFYTLDGTAPIPRNPSAFLYNGVISGIAAGTVIKAQSSLWGYNVSLPVFVRA